MSQAQLAAWSCVPLAIGEVVVDVRDPPHVRAWHQAYDVALPEAQLRLFHVLWRVRRPLAAPQLADRCSVSDVQGTASGLVRKRFQRLRDVIEPSSEGKRRSPGAGVFISFRKPGPELVYQLKVERGHRLHVIECVADVQAEQLATLEASQEHALALFSFTVRHVAEHDSDESMTLELQLHYLGATPCSVKTFALVMVAAASRRESRINVDRPGRERLSYEKMWQGLTPNDLERLKRGDAWLLQPGEKATARFLVPVSVFAELRAKSIQAHLELGTDSVVVASPAVKLQAP